MRKRMSLEQILQRMDEAARLRSNAKALYKRYFDSTKPHYVNGCRCYSEGHLPGVHGRASLSGLAALMCAERLCEKADKVCPFTRRQKRKVYKVPTIHIF